MPQREEYAVQELPDEKRLVTLYVFGNPTA